MWEWIYALNNIPLRNSGPTSATLVQFQTNAGPVFLANSGKQEGASPRVISSSTSNLGE